MSGVNRATILGNVGGDPEIKRLNSGSKVANFSVATSQSQRDKQTGEKVERTQWHRCVVFSEHLVDVVEKYLVKGDKVYLEGQIETRKWTDQSGAERYVTEIVLRFNGVIQLLGSRAGRDGDGDDKPSERRDNAGSKAAAKPSVDSDIDDAIPF